MAEFAYNNAPHSSTTVSPFFANKGYHPRSTFTPLDVPVNAPLAKASVVGLSQLHDFLCSGITKANQASAEAFNKSRGKLPEYNIGDKVWLSAQHIKTARPAKKLDHCYLGPFEISEKISSHAYRLALPTTMKIHNVFHVHLLEPFVVENTIPNRLQSTPLPIEVEGQEEYEVEAILDSKLDNRFKPPWQYLVKWLGYNDTTWQSLANLNSMDLVTDYHARYKLPLPHA